MTVQDIIVHKIMFNDPIQLSKTLWRVAKGKRSVAYKIIRDTVKRYTDTLVTDTDIECALAELNGGCEVEWEEE